MGIWNILWKNLGSRARTRKPDDVVPHPETYRGVLLHDPARCTACATCAYVCSPSAITFNEKDRHTVAWEYNAGQCTYCGRCVAYCLTGALRFEPEAVGARTALADFHVSHAIEYHACARCGKSYIPLPGSYLLKLYGDPLPADIAAARLLCEECRNRLATRNLKEAVYGQLARRGGDLIDKKNPPAVEETK